MTLWFWVLLTIGLVIACDLLVVVLRKYINLAVLRAHHDVTSPLLSVVGTLFAVLLGFMVSSAMTKFEEARNNVQQEAGAVGDIFRLASGLPEKDKQKLLSDAYNYVSVVVNEEWPLMEDHKMSDKAWNYYGDIWLDCTNLNPQTQKEGNIQQVLLEGATRLGDARRARLAQLSYCLAPSLWVVVIAGAAATVSFTFFFGMESLAVQLAMTSFVVSILSLNIYLLYSFSSPFNGDIKINSSPMQVDKTMFEEIKNKNWH
jgi:Protein of unknown function (DUF4239)